jgi:hypothetical protein
MKITAELLIRKGACSAQIDKFWDMFPEGVEPTRELCIAHANDFEWGWAAAHLLSLHARKTYDETTASAWFDAWAGDNQ